MDPRLKDEQSCGEIRPFHIDVTEIYRAGFIIRPFKDSMDRVFIDEPIELIVTYKKNTPIFLQEICEPCFADVVLCEHLWFGNQNTYHPYFRHTAYEHPVYGGIMSKWTKKDGSIEREHRKNPLER